MMAQYQGAAPYTGMNAFPDRVVRRPMTGPEAQKLVKIFKKLQTVLRGLSPVPLLFAFLDLFVLPSLPTEVSIFFYVIQVVLILAVLLLAGAVFSLRKKTTEAFKDGVVYEVSGLVRPAAQKNKNLAGWTVGPVMLASNRAKPLGLQEGMPASLVCVPKTGGLLSVNNADAENGWVKCPPDIDRYVSGAPSYPPAQPPAAFQPQPQYQPQPPAPQQPAWPVYQPPSQPAAQYPPQQPQSYQQPQQYQPQPQPYQPQQFPQQPQSFPPQQYPQQPQSSPPQQPYPQPQPYPQQQQPYPQPQQQPYPQPQPYPQQPYQPPAPQYPPQQPQPAAPPQFPSAPPGQK